ncbi:iron-sulfur cluster assembly scaffold protein [Blastomonas sp.]|uniref:iron-sulfur cluster assembly scaffold protein n=1 Tax=Blastomonas sp. TaxID=1909299 RepID=UPI003593324C
MTAPAQPLYTREILALAVSLADWPLGEALAHQAELRSQSCGSVVRVGIDLDERGRVTSFGVNARACALGQASTAILAGNVVGADAQAIATARDQLERFLDGARDDPGEWPGIEHLASARPYPARHGSILLPWRAALAALSSPVTQAI